MGYRPQYKAANRRAVLSQKTEEMIQIIRQDIPSGEDGDGWSSVCRNWRTGGGSSNGRPSASSNQRAWDNRGRGGGGGGTGGSRAPPRFTNSAPSGAPNGAPGGTPSTVTVSAPAPAPNQRYVSRFKPTIEAVESTIVNTIILNKLNKFSPANYDEVKEFLMEILGSGELDFLSDFMKLVFRKAASEETFCPLYAKLLNELTTSYPFLLNEMDQLYKKFLDIFQEVDETQETNMEELMQKNKEKKYRHGYAQFLAELFKLNIVETAPFIETMNTIMAQINRLSIQEDKSMVLEEYALCTTIIFKSLQEKNKSTTSARAALAPLVKEHLSSLTTLSSERPSLTNRIRFTILNIIDYVEK
jgi:hypothetical protein